MIITNYKIPADISRDFRFAFVSDIHNAQVFPILEAIAKHDAEAILVSGDFINDGLDYENGLHFLAESTKMKPTFVSIGNHERKFGDNLLQLIQKTGVTLLDDDSVLFHEVLIGGLSSGFGWRCSQGNHKKTPLPNLLWLDAFAARKEYKILLSHHPEYYPAFLKNFDVNLILSGHAHGGQWRVFGQGIFAPGQGLFPKYTAGLFDGKLLVGRGLGDSHRFPPRIWNPPELIFVTLKKK